MILCVLMLFTISLLVFSWKKQRTIVLTFGMFSDSNWDTDSENTTEIVEAAIRKFEAKHSKVKIKYESGIQKEDYTEWLEGKFLTGDEPDVFMVSADTFYALASKGALLELSDFMKKDEGFLTSDFYDVGIKAGKYQSKQYALPYEAVPLLMCVNTTLLNSMNIVLPTNDWTWGDFHAICRKATKDTDGDERLDQFGVCRYTWKEAAYSNGASLFNEDGTENYISHQDVVNAVNYIYKIYALTDGYTVTEQEFEAGNVVFTPMLLTNYRMYKNNSFRNQKYADFSWTCITMPAGPQGDNTSEVDTLLGAIGKRSRHQKLAWEFLKMLTGDEEIQKMVARESKGVSVLKKVTESKEVYNEKNNIDTRLLVFSMEKGVTISKFANYEEAINKMDNGVLEAMSSDKDIQASLLTLQKNIDSYLKND